MIQFPAGPPAGLPQLGVENLASPRILPVLADLARTPLAPADIIELGKAATAALDLELLQTPAGQPAPAVGAAEYQLAIDAVKQGDQAVVLQHLEQAILIHPSYADTARLDPAFEPIRGPVQDLVGRLSVLARIRAETSIAEASAAIESAQAPEPAPEPVPPLASIVATGRTIAGSGTQLASDCDSPGSAGSTVASAAGCASAAARRRCRSRSRGAAPVG